MQPEQGTTVLNFLLPVLENEIQTTRRILAAVPADKGDYRPDDRSMNALELCWHIAGAEAFFATAITTGAFATPGKMPETIKTSQDVVAWYDGFVKSNLPNSKRSPESSALKSSTRRLDLYR